MTDLVYIIQAHKNPHQLKRLIEKIDSENAFFYVHIDLKSDIKEFKSVIQKPNVFFIEERVDCIWGDFSQVAATLNLIEIVLKKHANGMCIFLSGQDYPIKPIDAITDFLSKNSDKNFIDIREIAKMWDKKECKKRTRRYRYNFSNERGDFAILTPRMRFLKLVFKKKIPLSLFIKSFIPRQLDMKFYGGSNWWAFNFDTLNKIHRYIDDNKKKLYGHFIYTHCADEIFFHTIIKHLIKNDDTIVLDDTITYVNWSRKNCPLPVTFNQDDYEELATQPEVKLFARKFDTDYDGVILDILDQKIV